MVEADIPYSHYYDNGVWANLKEVFSPRCFEPDNKYPNAKKLIPPTVDKRPTPTDSKKNENSSTPTKQPKKRGATSAGQARQRR